MDEIDRQDGLILGLLQDLGHLDHGGNRWNYKDPQAVVCNCGERIELPSQHFLIVHEESDDGMDVEHPPSCPTASIYDGRVLIHTCDVGRIADEWGLDMFFRRDAAPAGRLDSEQVKPGRHPIEVWGDGNLRLSEVSDA